MLADTTENIVIRDWFAFTSKQHDPMELADLIGLGHLSWMNMTGRYGYQERLYFGGISILYNGRPDMGVCCEMSGQGCRSFEEHTKLSGKWDDLIPFVRNNNLHITRLDVAFDDHTGVLDIDTIFQDSIEQKFISKSRCYEPHMSGRTDSHIVGKSVTFGSRQSDMLIRIYNKAAERGFDDDRHWVRVELQMKDKHCAAFLELCDTMTLGEAFSGVLLNYLRFVEPDETDSNKSRWTTAEYWARFLEDVSRIRLYTAPGTEYNLEKCSHYVLDMAGNAIAAYMEIVGTEEFLEAIKHRTCRPNPKYELLVKEHYAKLEKLREKAKLAFEFDESDTPVWGSFSEEVLPEVTPQWWPDTASLYSR